MKIQLTTLYHAIFLFMLSSIIFMVAWSWNPDKGPSTVEECFPDTIDFSEGWYDTAGNEIDTAKLHNVEGTSVNEEFSIFHDMPTNISEGDYLCFRSKNVFFQVYVDGNLVYDPYVPESIMYTKSYGTRWNYFPLPAGTEYSQLEFRIQMPYQSGRASIDNLQLGQPSKAVMTTIGDKTVAFITSILLLFVGVILIIADIPINLITQKNHELLYLGFFALSIATWCFAETHLIQYFIANSRVIQLISCYSLMLIPIPFVLYFNTAFNFKNPYFSTIIVLCSFTEFIVCTLLHFTGVYDLHETLVITHILLLFLASILAITTIRLSFMNGKHSNRNTYTIIRGVGLTAISITTAIDVYRYYKGSSNDTAMFVRIGLLIFIICFGSSSLEKTINAVKLGAKAELISQLAYQDGLTGTGNRTAFEERLTELESIKDELSSIAIIMFDVNDLKYVNDHLGHPEGDKLLLESATLISNTFHTLSDKCYRIGGDEFAIILTGDNVKQLCETGLKKFETAMRTYNSISGNFFRISVASGYAIYDKAKYDSLLETYQQADKQMYQNKMEMKKQETPPSEYYQEKMQNKQKAVHSDK